MKKIYCGALFILILLGVFLYKSQVSLSIPSASAQTSTPYGGTPWAIPGTIEAENYDNGGEAVAYHDLDALNSGGGVFRTTEGVDVKTSPTGETGYTVGWIKAGEWVKYSTNVTSSGNYDIKARVAAPSTGGTFHIELDGVDVTGQVTLASTGSWTTQSTMTVKNSVNLTASSHIIKIVFDTNGASLGGYVGDLNYLTITPTPPVEIRIDSGATTGRTDSNGKSWSADTGFVGGTALDRGAITISGTTNQFIYQTERYSMTGYNVAVPNGTYTVNLHFAETYSGITGAGQRLFSVGIEGTTVLTNFDIFADAGGANKADVKSFPVTVSDGQLNITFTKNIQETDINGIEIISGLCPSLPTNTGSVSTTITLAETGNYTVWSRVKSTTGSSSSYYLQVDNSCPVTVGGISITPDTWTWVDYQNGSTTNKILLNLTSGNHTITIVGKDPSLALDKILFVKDVSCVPQGLGDNCISALTPTATPIPPTSTPGPTNTPAPLPSATPTPALASTPTPVPATPTPTRTPTPTPIPGKYALKFDGVNDVAVTVNLPVLTTYTLETWVKRTSDLPNYQTFLSDANSSYTQENFGLYIDNNNTDCTTGPADQLAFAYVPTTSGFYTICSGVSAGLNTWHHVAVTRDNSTGVLRIFVDGVLANTLTATPAPADSAGTFTMGAAGSSNSEYSAVLLDEIRLSNSVRYSSTFTPSTTQFSTDASTIGLWHLNEGTGQTVADASGNGRNGVLGTTSSVESSDPVWSTDSPVN